MKSLLYLGSCIAGVTSRLLDATTLLTTPRFLPLATSLSFQTTDFRGINSLLYTSNRQLCFSRDAPSSITMFKNIIKNPCAKITVVPTLSDNYAYLLVDPVTKDGLCVDPAEPKKVIDAAKEEGVTLVKALCTHKHWDHSGGNREVKRLLPEIEVVGSAYEQVPAVTQSVKDGDVLPFGSLEIKCIKASCHTLGHIMYFVHSPANPNLQPILFTGDTIFIAGCGRFFEGSAKMMLEIMEKLDTLPPDTLVYCGHEYTVNNLKFAQTVDNSPAVEEKLNWAKETRSLGLPTVPSTLQEERMYNPFMRTSQLKDLLKEDTTESTMKKLRDLKDRF